MHNIFPWQQQKWQYLVERKTIGQFPHAILITGQDGVGKFCFAQNLVALLLCHKNDSTGLVAACGECDSCGLLQANNHPDAIFVQAEEPGKAIKIDQVREVIVELNNTSHQGGYKVVVIKGAELLNIAASNALLKTLEEPVSNVVIILISARPLQLPATIRSRCQILSLPTPGYYIAKEWLEQQLPNVDIVNIKLLLALSENAPLNALNLTAKDELAGRQEFFGCLEELYQGKINVVQMATRCLDWGIENLLLTLMHVVHDMIKIKFAASNNIVNQDQLEKLTSFAARTTTAKLFPYKEYLYKIRRHLMRKINLNQQLIMEHVIITWSQMFA